MTAGHMMCTRAVMLLQRNLAHIACSAARSCADDTTRLCKGLRSLSRSACTLFICS